MTHFDLVIIGSGSGNSLLTPDFDDLSVAVIERNPTFGGTCLNVGCIPTKMFVYAADIATAVRESSRYGVRSRFDGADWPAIRDRVFGRIDPISAAGKEYRRSGSPNVTLIEGSARFTGPRTLDVDGQTLTADRIVIATGSHAIVPEAIESSGVSYHTSDTIMRIERLPRSMVIVGGGYIASEFAHVFGALGTRVHLVTRGPALLRHLDEEISADFTALAKQQWDLHLGRVVESARDVEGRVEVTLDDGTSLDADALLVATGRVPTTADLDPEAAGVALHDDGRVVVDQFGRTTAEGVWALGDACSPYQLKHVANQQARAVAHNLAHPNAMQHFEFRALPAAVFTHPQIATVGFTQKEAIEAGHEVTVKVQKYGDTAYGWAMEDTTGVCKLVADRRTGQLLGAHLMGPQASSLIQVLVEAMAAGLDARTLARRQYWIHPALSEVVENALLGLDFD